MYGSSASALRAGSRRRLPVLGWASITAACLVWVLLGSCVGAAEETPGPETFELGGQRFQVLRSARHDTYDLTVVLKPAAETSRIERLDLLIAQQSETEYGRLTWAETGLTLLAVSQGAETELYREARPLPPDLADGATLTLKRRDWWLEVVVDGVRIVRVLDAKLRRGRAAMALGPGLATVAEARYQRTEPIAFADDFMRTEEETKDFGLWQPSGGEWRLYSIMEEVRTKPDARIREGHEPEAERSPNPFCLSGKAGDGALILTGYPFWDDYTVAVSTKTKGGQVGLAFGVTDADNLWLVRWGIASPALRPSRLELVRRVKAQEQLISAVDVTARTDNWYRLAVEAVGSRITVLVDQVPLLTAWSPESTGGRVGLYARGQVEAFFDDVAVKSWASVRFDHDEALRGHARPVSGSWATAGSTGELQFECRVDPGTAASAGNVYALGLDSWQGYCFRARIEPRTSAGVVGLVFAGRTGADLWRFTWSAAGRGTASLVSVAEGREQVVAQGATELRAQDPHEFAVDLREKGAVKCYVDGSLELRHRPQSDLSGWVGLYSSGDARPRFRDVEAFADLPRDWEQPVKTEVFTEDPYMQGWASPRWAWVPVKDAAGTPADGTRTYVNKGDIYGALQLTLPISHGLAVLFGADGVPEEAGYRLQVELQDDRQRGTVALRRRGEALGQAEFQLQAKAVIPGEQIVDEKIGALPKSPDTVSYGMLSLGWEGKYMVVTAEGKELLAVRDDSPLSGRGLGLVLHESLDLAQVEVRRDHIRDYLFETAPVDWSKVGVWEVTNRFACDPRWSHLNGRSKGVAAFWNKLAFDGDFTVEFHAGMQMRQGDMHEGAPQNYYPRVGDINLCLGGDGRDLFSGYNLIIAAWDPLWSERWTQFWRRAQVVEKTEQELIPRTRDARPQARAIEVEWDPGGRPIHGAWYHVKVRRTGGRFDFWFDDVPVFSYTDSKPLTGRQLALWTQHNSIVVARAKVGYRRVSTGSVGLKPSVPAAAPPPPTEALATSQPQLCSDTHPGRRFEFETGAEGWETSPEVDQGAGLSLVPGAGRDGQALQLTNLHAGGDFGVVIPVPGLDLGRVPRIELDCAIPAEVKVNLYLSLQDEPYERYFVTLSGPADDAPNLVCLGAFAGFEADGKWHHVTFDLGRALHQKLPQRQTFPVQRLLLGQLHEGYLNAGLGGNPEGASYRLDNVVIGALGPTSARLTWAGTDDAELRSKWICSRALNADLGAAVPHAGVTGVLDLPGPGFWYVHGAVAREDKWVSAVPVPVWAESPLTVVGTEPGKDEVWDGGPIAIRFRSDSLAHPDLTRLKLEAGGHELRVDSVSTVYDQKRQLLTVDPGFTEVTFRDGEQVEFRLTYWDDIGPVPAAKVAPVPTSEGTAGTATAAKSESPAAAPAANPAPAASQSYSWACRLVFAKDRTPPSRVRLPAELYPALDFAAGIGGITPVTTGKHIRLSRVARDGGAGSALKVDNALCGSDFAVNFELPVFSVGKFPILAFDYKTMPEAHADFLLKTVLGLQSVCFMDKNNTETPVLGSVPEVTADGKWHHAEVDLRQLVDSAPGGFAPKRYEVRKLSLGDWGYTAIPPGVSHQIADLSLIPVVSTVQELRLSWKAQDLTGIQGYNYLWSRDPDAKVEKTVRTATGSASVKDLPDGETWFHVRAQDGAGNWGPVSRYRFRIDNVPPVVRETGPPAGTGSAGSVIAVRFDEGGSGVDPGTLSLTVNGSPCALSPAWTTWTAEKQELAWNWVEARRNMKTPIPDGQKMLCRLAGVTDFAGNSARPVEWAWQIDYAQDKDGPLPPRIVCYTQKLLQFDDFSEGVGRWSPVGRAEKGTDIAVVTDDETRDKCLRIRKTDENAARFAAFGFRGQWEPEQYPLLAFEYKLTPGTKANLILYLNDQYRLIRMTGGDTLPEVGAIPDVKDDGKWHSVVANVHQMLRQSLPDETKYLIRYLALGHWQARANQGSPVGATFFVDNFAILGTGSPLPEVYCSASDATGISGYSYSMDRDPRGAPPDTVVAPADVFRCAAVDEPGLWFIHARARDGAGNLGLVSNYPYYCPAPVPSGTGDDPEKDAGWQAAGEAQGTNCSLQTTQTAGRGDRILVLGVRTWREDQVLLRRSASVQFGPKTTLAANLYLQGKVPIRVAAYLRRDERSKIVVSDPVEVQPDQWLTNARLVFPADSGAKADGAAAAATYREYGLVFYAPARLHATLVANDIRLRQE